MALLVPQLPKMAMVRQRIQSKGNVIKPTLNQFVGRNSGREQQKSHNFKEQINGWTAKFSTVLL